MTLELSVAEIVKRTGKSDRKAFFWSVAQVRPVPSPVPERRECTSRTPQLASPEPQGRERASSSLPASLPTPLPKGRECTSPNPQPSDWKAKRDAERQRRKREFEETLATLKRLQRERLARERGDKGD